MVPHDPKVVAERLLASRRNLLDTGRRNRLINYRPSRASGAEITGEDPFEIHRLLVVEGKAMSFRGKEDPPKLNRKAITPAGQETLYIDDDSVAAYEHRVKAEQELAEDLGYQSLPVDLADLILNTDEYVSKLKVRLLKTYRDARTITEESGVNVLFLALGMLHWQEQDPAQTPRRSPLVLIPVDLEPKANGEYNVRYDGSEIGSNLSLQAMLKAEFGIQMPLPAAGEELDIRGYFAQVRKSIATKPDWHVDDRAVALGFFSYAKYLLYMDLAEEHWQEDSKPQDHSLLGSLLDSGFQDEGHGLPDDEKLDPHRPVEQIHDVIGADGSQTLAVLEAASGRSMVIQGPPGTGKSQTITNLIADALAKGKTVLFVAEKMAALDVVARRMKEAGLKDACLELHSHKTRKTDFYKELRRVQEEAPPALIRASAELEMLESRREELNAYAEAVNLPVEGRVISPRHAMGKLVQLGEESPGLRRFDFAGMAGWTEETFKKHLPIVEALQGKVAQIGSPMENRFYGSKKTLLLALDIPQLTQQVQATAASLRTAQEAGAALAETLSIDAPERLDDLGVAARAAKRAAEAPPLQGVAVNTSVWSGQEARIRAILAAGSKLAELRKRHSGDLVPTAWQADVAGARAALVQHGEKWYRFLIGDYRSAAKQIDALCVAPGKPVQEKIVLADAILQAQAERQVVTEADELGKSLFGVQWQGDQSDWHALSTLADWVIGVHRSVGSGEIPPGFLRFFDGTSSDPTLAPRADEVLRLAQHSIEAIRALVQSLEFGKPPPALLGSFADALDTLDYWAANMDRLEQLVGFNKLVSESSGIPQAAALAAEWDLAGTLLVEAFSRTWYEGVIREAFASRPPLQKFDRLNHEAAIAAFRKLDDELLRYNQSRIRRMHYEQVPRSLVGGSAAWLQKQMGLKRTHKPIRVAMEEAGPVIQAIKPVMMMSPLSVAMYLPQNGPRFDLVIFDEASQVKPEDAFGSILRAKQVIVVGDSKQMPPTSFFDKMTSGDEDLDEVEAEANVTRDMESVLSLMDARIGARSPRRRDLRWHYRSRHHSLIAPSNALFYSHRLFLFPNPEPPSRALGLRLHHLANTVYDRGASRTNRMEAQTVAKAVKQHVHEHPEESLMVVAFSQAQQQAVQDEIDLILRGDPAFESFAAHHATERLDVKNLENVQGDERDVVFISVGYGKDGKGYASMSFGPLNAEGGERRLNVLITRARRRCEVFTNLKGEDIKSEGSASQGLFAFKEFLHYAETGKMNVAVETGLEPMSPFEEAVIEQLRLSGYDVVPQVGSAGFFIDIGVRDPDKPTRFILGIECDGAQYHSSRTARDRDKLRQAVLEDRGWRIHRIWSTDWWSHPDRELRRCIEAIELARAGKASPESEPEAESDPVVVEVVEAISAAPSEPPIPPYRTADLSVPFGTQLHELNRYQMASLVRQVVAEESPVHIDEVVRRIREAGGFGRAGERMRQAVEGGAKAAEGSDLYRQGDFLFMRGKEIALRSRSGQAVKKLEYVSEAEIEIAIQRVVERAFSISPEEVAPLSARLLGFDRATAAMRARIGEVAAEMCRNGRLQLQNGKLSSPSH